MILLEVISLEFIVILLLAFISFELIDVVIFRLTSFNDSMLPRLFKVSDTKTTLFALIRLLFVTSPTMLIRRLESDCIILLDNESASISIPFKFVSVKKLIIWWLFVNNQLALISILPLANIWLEVILLPVKLISLLATMALEVIISELIVTLFKAFISPLFSNSSEFKFTL